MASKRSRVPQPRSLRRKVGTRQPRKTLVVFCEGEKTEPQYLLALRQEPFVKDAAAVDIQVETGRGGAVPLTLVTLAVAARAKSAAEEAEIDEFWCVFDVEWPRNHPHLRESIAKAEANDIRLAISNPCFELWLILHYRNQGSWLDNSAAVELRRHRVARLDPRRTSQVLACRSLHDRSPPEEPGHMPSGEPITLSNQLPHLKKYPQSAALPGA
jgi:RloB-like protein